MTPTEKRVKREAKAERQKKYEWIFLNGKQVRVRRPELIDGVEIDEFVGANADPIWLHQNERWELMDTTGENGDQSAIREDLLGHFGQSDSDE